MATMQHTRDIQTFQRNERTRATVSACSALGMEIKRKKIRQSTVFLHNEDSNIQEKIDFEIRMREGAYKLLVASTKREQILNASKSLLTCNTRIKVYMSELQKRKEGQDARGASGRRSSDDGCRERVACKGKVALSGLRIPLMWKDSDHFNNKGSSRRVAVFCLMKIGAEVFDTEMVVVDRSATDICFEGSTIFTEAGPGFELTLELYSCAVEEETSLANTPKKLAKRLRTSLGKASGKKLCPLLEAGDPEAFMLSNPVPPASKFSLLAYTALGLPQAEGSFLSHSLSVIQNAESSSWLPLYGNLCCRLVAQPDCMTQDVMSGFLNQQQSVGGVPRSCTFYCVLRAGTLSCYFSPEEIHAKMEAAVVIPINKETRIRVVEKDPRKGSNSVTIINPVEGGAGATHVFTAESREQLEDWMEAFWQHFYDQLQWQQCCSELMKLEVTSPKKPPLFQTRHADSVYNDLSIGSPGKFESLTDIIHSKIEETDGRFLIGQEEETKAPDWAVLFEGSHSLVVQKSVLLPDLSNNQPGPSSSATKKRRAPPPPPDRQPYTPPPPPDREPHAPPHLPDRQLYAPPPLPDRQLYAPPSSALQQGTEGRRRPGRGTGRPSLDAKFSAIIQQLQRNSGLSRNPAPLSQRDAENQPPERPPQPAPRQKPRSFREKMKPKVW
ncbi:rhotekin-2 [Megalops cyprinoides]|uniref:rhotekin-2 n=1 Tax=Megalops cyprinoides TaxID=118141 RepID=UPI0018649B11|nr:rhotekin-2 [Megalops cyprinoides]